MCQAGNYKHTAALKESGVQVYQRPSGPRYSPGLPAIPRALRTEIRFRAPNRLVALAFSPLFAPLRVVIPATAVLNPTSPLTIPALCMSCSLPCLLGAAPASVLSVVCALSLRALGKVPCSLAVSASPLRLGTAVAQVLVSPRRPARRPSRISRSSMPRRISKEQRAAPPPSRRPGSAFRRSNRATSSGAALPHCHTAAPAPSPPPLTPCGSPPGEAPPVAALAAATCSSLDADLLAYSLGLRPTALSVTRAACALLSLTALAGRAPSPAAGLSAAHLQVRRPHRRRADVSRRRRPAGPTPRPRSPRRRGAGGRARAVGARRPVACVDGCFDHAMADDASNTTTRGR